LLEIIHLFPDVCSGVVSASRLVDLMPSHFWNGLTFYEK